MRKKAYRARDVKNVDLAEVLRAVPAGSVWVGMDIGKYEIYVVLRWQNGHFERPWKVSNPTQLKLLVALLGKLAESHSMIVALESTPRASNR